MKSRNPTVLLNAVISDLNTLRKLFKSMETKRSQMCSIFSGFCVTLRTYKCVLRHTYKHQFLKKHAFYICILCFKSYACFLVSWTLDWTHRLSAPPAVVQFLSGTQCERGIKVWVIHGVPHNPVGLWVQALQTDGTFTVLKMSPTLE